jgi:beta-glucosidase
MITHQKPTFPAGFVWGFATAAPQIEGAGREDGKSPSVWDHFARQPGRVRNGDNLDAACQHYHHYKEDVALMRSLGAKNYRFSIAWPRILPGGDGAVNQKGVDFYHRLIDALLENGITPWVTMFHWDLPQVLEDRFGGWRDRRIVDAFANYAGTIVRAYGDRVKNWITLNEISCFTYYAYGTGVKAPGLQLPEGIVSQAYHHALLAHGQAVRAVREHGGAGARVGLSDNTLVGVPVSETDGDIAAARAYFTEANCRTIDPIFRGCYHADYLQSAGADAPLFAADDFTVISQPTDFLGMNLYSGLFVRAPRDGGKFEVLDFPPSYPQADNTWQKIMPQVLYWGPRLAAELCGTQAVYITENGCGYDDAPPVNGEVIDLHRRDLVRNYLGELHRAIRDGVPVKGYFLWSLMDNFEWEDGYERRFGAVYCDYQTLRRTPKLSAHWYAKVMAENTLV